MTLFSFQSMIFSETVTQETHNCAKSTMEKLKKGVKYVLSYQERHHDVVLVSLLYTLSVFHTLLGKYDSIT